MRYDPAPIIPALRQNLRYEWLPDDDPDRAKLLEGVQEGARGLEIVWCPFRRRKCVIELYEPWELRHEGYRAPVAVVIPNVYGPDELTTMSEELNPYQYEDFKLGRRVCTGERWVLELEPPQPDRAPRPFLEPGPGDPFPGGLLSPTPLDERLLLVIRKHNHAARVCYDQKAGDARAQFRIELEHEVVDKKEAQLEAEAEEVGGYGFGRELGKALTPKETVLADVT